MIEKRNRLKVSRTLSVASGDGTVTRTASIEIEQEDEITCEVIDDLLGGLALYIGEGPKEGGDASILSPPSPGG